MSKIPNPSAFLEQIYECAKTLELPLSQSQAQKLLEYLDNLLLWTKTYNLTAITDPQEALIKHIFDCMAIVPYLPFVQHSGIRLLDIGTGAGLPAVIIAILKPTWHITALDSNGKKIRFIRQMATQLGLTNLDMIASRIENFTGCFDVITSRAFASLEDFVQLATPYLADDGVLYAMKGKMPSDDDMTALKTWQIDVCSIIVPQLSDDRCVVSLTKNK